MCRTNQDLHLLLRYYQNLTPEQQVGANRLLVRRAQAERLELIKSLFRAVVSWFRRRAAVAQLRALDDRMLKDIGIERDRIEAAAGGNGGHRRRPPHRH